VEEVVEVKKHKQLNQERFEISPKEKEATTYYEMRRKSKNSDLKEVSSTLNHSSQHTAVKQQVEVVDEATPV